MSTQPHWSELSRRRFLAGIAVAGGSAAVAPMGVSMAGATGVSSAKTALKENSLVAPTPPKPDTTIWLKLGTQQELTDAIQNARGNGHVTRIVLKKNTTIPIDHELPHFDMTDGKRVVIDFNGGSLAFGATMTTLWFEAEHGAVEGVSFLASAAGGNTTIRFAAALPGGLAVGDHMKVVAEDRAPGNRSDRNRVGQAVRVIAIDGLEVTVSGELIDSGLYKTNVRASKYFGAPEGLWLIQPRITGQLSQDPPNWPAYAQINLRSLVQPRIISPYHRRAIGAFISLEDTVSAIVTDPDLAEGVDGAWPHMTYGIYSMNSTNNWVYRTAGSPVSPNGQTIRHVVDSGQNAPDAPESIYLYGNDIGLRVTGLQLWYTLNVNASVHAGSWAALYEDLNIRRQVNGAAGFGFRGDYGTFRNIDIAEVKNGWQIYNERGAYTTDPIDTTPNGAVIDGGSTVVSGTCLFTSSHNGADGTPMPIGDISTRNSPYWESTTSGQLFSLGHDIDLAMDGDRIKATGEASIVFSLSGNASLTGKNMTIDLSEYKGDRITLFSAAAGSVVRVTGLTLIDPNNKAIISGGDGDVSVSMA